MMQYSLYNAPIIFGSWHCAGLKTRFCKSTHLISLTERKYGNPIGYFVRYLRMRMPLLLTMRTFVFKEGGLGGRQTWRFEEKLWLTAIDRTIK